MGVVGARHLWNFRISRLAFRDFEVQKLLLAPTHFEAQSSLEQKAQPQFQIPNTSPNMCTENSEICSSKSLQGSG